MRKKEEEWGVWHGEKQVIHLRPQMSEKKGCEETQRPLSTQKPHQGGGGGWHREVEGTWPLA